MLGLNISPFQSSLADFLVPVLPLPTYMGRWVQVQCRNIGEYDAPEVEPALQAAVAALRERPVLFKYCAEEVGHGNSHVIVGA